MIEEEITDSNRYYEIFHTIIAKAHGFTKESTSILIFTGSSGTWSEQHGVVGIHQILAKK